MVAGQIVTRDLSELVSLHMRKRRPIERLKDSHCPVRRYLIASVNDSARIGFNMVRALKCASAEWFVARRGYLKRQPRLRNDDFPTVRTCICDSRSLFRTEVLMTDALYISRAGNRINEKFTLVRSSRTCCFILSSSPSLVSYYGQAWYKRN